MTIHLIDLGNVVAIVLGSMASVLAFFQILRTLFLDRLTQAMEAAQRDVLYRVLVWFILTLCIVGLALLSTYQFSLLLVVSAGVAAIPLVGGVHVLYTGVQKRSVAVLAPAVATTFYPEIPAGTGSDIHNSNAA